MPSRPPAALRIASLAALVAAGAVACGPGIAASGAAPPRSDARLGRVEFANSGAAAAQGPFLDGLAALHSFFYDEAADRFRAAQEVDPGFAMAYWGEAMTYNHPLWHEQVRDSALAALERLGATAAERAAKAGSERERAYLAAVETLYGTGTGEDAPRPKKERDRLYSAAMRGVMERYPDDLDAAAFYALSLQGLNEPGGLDLRHQMRSAAIVEEVFAANPLHPGAAHYLIHAYDDPVHAPLGLRAARVYAEIAPAAHHALHMPSHIFVQLGMWDRAAASNEDAYAASVAWVDERGHPIEKRDFHSFSWLQYVYLQQGRIADAERLVAELETIVEAGAGGHTGHVLGVMKARQAVESRDWAELEVPDEVAGAGSRNAIGDFLFGAGLSAAERGDRASAERAAAHLERLADEHEGDYRELPLEIMGLELRGVLAFKEGRVDDALAHLAEAASLEDELGPPSGPPSPIKPAHELYGELLLAAGKAEAARRQLALSLERTPNRAASLLAAAEAAAAQGDAGDARAHYETLVRVWESADDRPVVRRVYQRAGSATGG